MNNFYVSDDKLHLNIDLIHAFLTRSYWAKNISLATVKKSIEHSLCFGIYAAEHQQVGFARVITDQATFAYLSDVFVLEEYRGQGLSKQLIQYVQQHAELQHLRRIVLATSDAHTLYEQFGFEPLNSPTNFMEIWQPNIYQAPNKP